jgi:hypothetical protein
LSVRSKDSGAIITVSDAFYVIGPLSLAGGATVGAMLYGELVDHDSTWTSTAIGAATGTAVGIAGAWLLEDVGHPDTSAALGVTSLLLGPALGATLGYVYGLRGLGNAGLPMPMVSADRESTTLGLGWIGRF